MKILIGLQKIKITLERSKQSKLKTLKLLFKVIYNHYKELND